MTALGHYEAASKEVGGELCSETRGMDLADRNRGQLVLAYHMIDYHQTARE